MPSSDLEDISRAEKMGESRTGFLDEERVKKIRPISTPRNASVSLNPRRRERPAPEKKNAAQSAVLVKLKGVLLCSPILCSRYQWYMPIKKPEISVNGHVPLQSLVNSVCRKSCHVLTLTKIYNAYFMSTFYILLTFNPLSYFTLRTHS